MKFGKIALCQFVLRNVENVLKSVQSAMIRKNILIGLDVETAGTGPVVAGVEDG